MTYLERDIFSIYPYNGENIQEILCRHYTEIKRAVDNSNSALEIVQNLKDQGLKDNVIKTIQGLIDDGTLDALLNKHINDRIQFIQLRSAKEIGMIPRDPNQSKKNTELIVQNNLAGFGLILDDEYHIENANLAITKDFVIKGINASAKLTIKDIGNETTFRFTEGVNIEIENISISGTFARENYMLYFPINNFSADYFNIKKCKIELTNSIFSWVNFDKNIDPTIQKLGFKEVNILNNTFKNINKSCFMFFNCPSVYNVSFNSIKNFDNRFFNASIENSHQHVEKLSPLMKFKITHNNVVNEECCWKVIDRGQYFTFVLVEGEEVEYSYNSIEGMYYDKDTQTPPGQVSSLYDSYLCCKNVYYHHNVIKNCIGYDNFIMFMAKNGAYDTQKDLVRIYNHNTYTIEKDFMTRVRPIDRLGIMPINSSHNTSKFVMSDNVFDFACKVRFRTAPVGYNDFIFNNNTFISRHSTSGSLCAINTESNFIDGKSNIKITNNLINLSPDDALAFVGNGGRPKTIRVDNVIISNNNCIGGYYNLTVPFGNKVKITNNNIEYTSKKTQTPTFEPLYDYDIIDFDFNDNNIKATNCITTRFRGIRQLNNINESNTWLNKMQTSFKNGISIPLKPSNPYTETYNVIIRYIANSTLGVSDQYIQFKVSYDQGTGFNKLTYTNEAGLASQNLVLNNIPGGTGFKVNDIISGAKLIQNIRITNDDKLAMIFITNSTNAEKTIPFTEILKVWRE